MLSLSLGETANILPYLLFHQLCVNSTRNILSTIRTAPQILIVVKSLMGENYVVTELVAKFAEIARKWRAIFLMWDTVDCKGYEYVKWFYVLKSTFIGLRAIKLKCFCILTLLSYA